MFVVMTIVDVIRIPPSLLAAPVLRAVHSEIDQKYPNRVLLDVGLVLGRYGNCLEVGHGVCVAGDGGSHHECRFRLTVFRPFVDEVCLGRVTKSSAEGVRVSLGFFDDIFVPAYWMLRPSRYEPSSGLWIWSPQYDDDDEDDEQTEEDKKQNGAEEKNDAGGGGVIKTENKGGAEETQEQQPGEVKDDDDNNANIQGSNKKKKEQENRYEMEIGAEIRFKVKSINFTQVTKTAKGVQATCTSTTTATVVQHNSNNNNSGLLSLASGPATTTSGGGAVTVKAETGGAVTSSSVATAGGATGTAAAGDNNTVLRRRRSTSVGAFDETQAPPPPAMHIVASICEDGLGLTSWWSTPDDDGADGEGDEAENDEKEDEKDVKLAAGGGAEGIAAAS